MSDETATTDFSTMSIDPTAAEMLKIAEDCEIETAFSRSRKITPCSTGATGGCCKLCAMGPCRLIGKHDRGVCGADRATVAARNFTRQVAAGAAAHSDHGRDVALALRAIASGEIKDATIADPVKLAKVAGYMGIDAAGKDAMQLALEVADCALAQVNDLGFIAHVRDGEPGFSVYAGGGMGAESRVADRMEEWVPAAQVVRIAEAVRRLFDRMGDRPNRRRARLRFAVERVGTVQL